MIDIVSEISIERYTLSKLLTIPTGFQIEGASANNVVLYLDSYGNRDPRKNGESADGFAVKSGSGAGNILRGGRIWNNVDDGIDLWYALPTQCLL